MRRSSWGKSEPMYAALQVNDLLSPVVYATGAAQLVAPGEILGERISHGLETRAHMSFDMDAL